jgi:hypothetical protein
LTRARMIAGGGGDHVDFAVLPDVNCCTAALEPG